MPKIPDYIVDNNIRKELAETASHLQTLEKWHGNLMKKAKARTITTDESKLLKEIIKAHQNLNKKWRSLAPSLAQVMAVRARK